MAWNTVKNKIEEGIIPQWLANEIEEQITCPYCKLPIIANDNLTSTRCANFKCIGHLKYRADDMLKKLGVKNIGPETCEAIIRTRNLKNQTDIIPIIFKEKPRVYLWQIADFVSIPGFGEKMCEDLLIGYNSFKSYFEEEPYIPQKIKAFQKDLIMAQDKFTVLPSLAKFSLSVMISDSVVGFPNKQSFINKCNSLAGDTVRVVLGQKRQNHDYLITDNRASGYSKIDYALEHGIPIITSREFVAVLAMTVVKKKQEASGHI